MPRVRWTRTALADIEAIRHYLDGVDPRVALRTVDHLIAAARLLERYPAAGRRLGARLRARAVRRTPYRLIYRQMGRDVEVIRIGHVRENWQVET